MNIARAGVYASIATAAKLVAGLVIIKLVAWMAGPAGVGRLGQFMSLMSMLAVLAGGGISAGVVKYVAEYRDDPQTLSRLLAAALWYALCASCLISVIGLLLSQRIAGWLLGDPRYQWLIAIVASVQTGVALVNYILAVINGFMDVRRLACIQVVGSLLNIVLALGLAHALQLYGALLALVVGQALLLVVSIPAWWRSPYFDRGMLRMRFDREMTLRLAAFSMMTLTSALWPPVVNLIVRDHLASRFGWEQVGYWQSVSKVSDAYLLFLTTAINVYCLPRLASIAAREALVSELRLAYRYVMPAVVVLAVGVYVCRGWLTPLLFSDDFTAANKLYGPQLLGDVVKIASFILSYVMLAKAMTRLYVASEIAFAISYVALVFLLTTWFGLIGAMYAFIVNYLLYLAFNVVVVRRYLGEL